MVRLRESQGRWAVSHARAIVESVVQNEERPSIPDDLDPVFETERGAFVTLRKDGDLRGCIGRPRPQQTAVTAIREAAEEATRNDPRFRPVRPDELPALTVEVSVLTPPDTLDVTDPDRYPDRIQVGRDGLVISAERASGLLLPQVPVDRGWSAERFLREACRKAGLRGACFRDDDVTVETFEAQVFAERDPNGPIEEVELAPEVEP
ncbi:MAG: AmmeMemoRadiSam system protein A [Halodesulfurarchaeum sp.]